VSVVSHRYLDLLGVRSVQRLLPLSSRFLTFEHEVGTSSSLPLPDQHHSLPVPFVLSRCTLVSAWPALVIRCCVVVNFAVVHMLALL
jgi:hypothetical protein